MENPFNRKKTTKNFYPAGSSSGNCDSWNCGWLDLGSPERKSLQDDNVISGMRASWMKEDTEYIRKLLART